MALHNIESVEAIIEKHANHDPDATMLGRTR